MIRFCCEHCGHKIAVEDTHAGKRGKCPACGTIVTVPAESTVIDFNCAHCGQKISALKIHGGKKIVCPKCKNTLIVPAGSETSAESVRVVRFACSMCHQEIEEPENSRGKLVECPHCKEYVPVPLEARPPPEATVPAQRRGEDTSDRRLEELQRSTSETLAEEPDRVTERTLPWILDVFLYPISVSGMIHIVVFVIVPLLISAFIRLIWYLLGPHLGLATAEITEPVTIVLCVIFYSYVCYYLADCVISSGRGRRRATDFAMPNTISIGDFISQAFIIIGCIAICLSPVLLYSILAKRNDLWFWALSAYGICFLPMSLLRGIMFDTSDALNPIEIVRSIGRTLLPYCGLILFFLAVGGFIVAVIPRLPLWGFLQRALRVYLVFVLAGRLGWFYWWCKDKLQWEV